MSRIRTAVKPDAESITNFDLVAKSDSSRREFISQSIDSGLCYVFECENRIIAYGVLEYSFYGNGFIAMLYVHPQFRRRGFGIELIKHVEKMCQTEKLFTSTNQSNKPMQALLSRMEYKPSGVIENLDEDDPELVYFKRLKGLVHSISSAYRSLMGSLPSTCCSLVGRKGTSPHIVRSHRRPQAAQLI